MLFQVDGLLESFVSWAEEESLTRPIREWIYALLLLYAFCLLPSFSTAICVQSCAASYSRCSDCIADARQNVQKNEEITESGQRGRQMNKSFKS